MQTNLISIIDLPPVYPAEHVKELLKRTHRELSHLTPDRAEAALVDLFSVRALSDLVDTDGIIADYEYQPAVSHQEMTELVARITPFMCHDGTKTELESRLQAAWVVRNIINCVPQFLDDLVDYLTDESLLRTNVCFAGCLPKGHVSMVSGARMFDVEIAENAKDSDIEFSGSLAMTAMNKTSVESDSLGALPRQRILSKAAEYYLLHRYGYPVSSLWLAEFLAPTSFCKCPNPDCGGRHFGFVDAQASHELVLQNLDYINGFFTRSEAYPVTEGITLDEIAGSNILRSVSAVEALLLTDRNRAQLESVVALLDVAFAHKEHLKDIDLVRLILLAQVSVHLYGLALYDKSAQINEEVLTTAVDEATPIMDKIGQTTTKQPRLEHLPLYDAHNFFVAGVGLEGYDLGCELRLWFMASIFDASHYGSFVEFIKEHLDIADQLKPSTVKLFRGFINNFTPYMIGRGSLAGNTHMDALYRHCRTDAVIKVLSEMGHSNAMEKRCDNAKSEFERDYWLARLDVI